MTPLKSPNPQQLTEALSTPQSLESYDSDGIDPIAERKLLWKLDLVLIPLFMLLYATNFVDRTAVGNAKIAGLEKDLGLKGFEYNIALTLFYVTYILVEVPSNLALKRFGSIWLAILMIAFGVIAISTAFITNFTGLILTRMFLGIAEGGLLPGLVYVLSRYYRRKELVFRIGIFFGVAPSLAGAFGGLLSSGLLSTTSIGSVTSWRKIFLIEGIVTTGLGIICLFIIPADPEISHMLTEDERIIALKRIAADNVAGTFKREKTTFRLVLRAFNVNTCLNAFTYLLVNISFQGLSLFLPTVIATLGHFTTVESQLRTVPPYIVSIVWAVINSYFSFKIQKRGVCIAISLLLNIVGYAIFVGSKNPHARYGACFLAISGGAPSGPMMLTWATDNAAPETVRAVTTALIPSLGTIGAVIAVWTYLPDDAPNYHRGNSLNLATCSLACVLVLLGVRYVYWENAKRDHGERDYRLEGKSQKEIDELGARHPAYRYQP
ncbi:hypothetical protein M422DRAFT_76616 [Sphaerobolus stellatus SS14]|uniref:Major facilitator superfamily (MFS) profile domain-containing protein n=1 Tax=Sphaerobolus stellatus (strain SS14) TaxID=990650 RepID=A0A0C9TNT6_SPHS4|nr:hypothetical protein M422DRAFT_76616 [Sphaerobolus stellatus SS14]